MSKYIIKAYRATITCDWLGDDADVLIGVEENAPVDWWEGHYGLDEKIYYYFSPEEFAKLKVGDVCNGGEDFTIVALDKENPEIFEFDYEEDENEKV
jgi:hypothetical protein